MPLILQNPLVAPSKPEHEILNLSQEKFSWEGEEKSDVADGFFDNLILPQLRTKADWIKHMKSKNFEYQIEHKERLVNVYGNMAVLIGKVILTVNSITKYKLIYTEVYSKENNKWKLLNLHTASEH